MMKKLSWLLSIAALAASGLGVREAEAAASSDPSAHTEYGGLCNWVLTCGGLTARMRWSPAEPGCFAGAPPDMPLAVILPGHGYNDRYIYLQDHLARNGILSASIQRVSSCGGPGAGCAAAHQDVADDTLAYLTSGCFATNFLDRFPSASPVDFHRTGIVGHSRGGESARFLASTLNAHSDFTVRAVAALAPTRHTTQPIYGTSTQAYMLLYGTSDFDVPDEAAFASHDLAGWNEGSTPTAFDVDRIMKLLIGGSHTGFADGGLAWDTNQRTAARGYVNAFLRAWLRGDGSFYDAYIRGREKPGPFGSAIFTQYSTSVSRRVIDNFEDLNVSPNTLGGSVSVFGMDLAEAVETTTIAETEHVSRVLVVRPEQALANVRWNVPAAQQNASGYLYLSLRVGQLDGGGPTDARVWIRNAGVYHSVDVADYGGIAEPYGPQGHMHTVRIPLADLGPHDAVEAVYLQFTGANGVGKRFMVDNLEFAQSLFLVPLPLR
jgi:hypothetical protein